MQITDEMVEAAAKAHTPQFDRMTSDIKEYALIQMRSALEASLTAAPASAAERERGKRAFLAGWMRYNTASDADIQRAHTEFDAWWPEGTP